MRFAKTETGRFIAVATQFRKLFDEYGRSLTLKGRRVSLRKSAEYAGLPHVFPLLR